MTGIRTIVADQTLRSVPENGNALSLWLVVATSFAIHLALAAVVPLVQDEAYYALWATHPALGYYDHPPMTAWWIWLGERVLGPTPIGVRFVPVLGFAAVTALCWRIAVRLTGDLRSGFWAAVFFNAMIVPFALGFTATPDTPSIFFWALATLATIEAIEAREDRAAGLWWLLAGLAAGLGVVSKLTNLFFWLSLGLWLLLTGSGRCHLRRRWVWLSAGLGLVALLPYLIWNAQHDWLGLVRQFGRLQVAPQSQMWTWNFLFATVATVTPLIGWAAAEGVWRTRGASRLLVWLMVPLLLYMFLHSLHAQVQANWIAPLFPGLAVLAALGWCNRPRWLSIGAASFGIAVSLVARGLALRPGRPVFPGRNPANETKGWDVFSKELAARATREGAAWIATTDYGVTGELSFHLVGLPVWSVTEAFRYGFRGPFPHALCSLPGLLVTTSFDSGFAGRHFIWTGPAGQLARQSKGFPIRVYSITPVEGARDWPASMCQAAQNGTAGSSPRRSLSVEAKTMAAGIEQVSRGFSQ